VWVSDYGSISAERKKVLSHIGVEWEENGHDTARILRADTIVKSPGIPDTVPLVVQAKEKGIAVISEIEYASRHTEAKLIGITGSNGKTTTATLTHHLLHRGGVDADLVGNVGKSFAGAIADRLEEGEPEASAYVIELSSFQLDGISTMRLDVAILLNITPDHLDRYDYDFEKYVASKFRVTLNQRPEDAFIYCTDDEAIKKVMAQKKFTARLHPFSLENMEEQSAWIEGETLQVDIDRNTNNRYNMSIYELALQGRHNIYNSMAAGITGQIFNLSNESIRNSLGDFQNIEHRLELVSTVHGVEYINDSKATNVNATWYALESIKRPIIWIVGGVDKGNDYSQLAELVGDKVKTIICLGKDNNKIIKAFDDVIEDIFETSSAAEAVRTARFHARKGDSVLLSPACASFDLFKNYEERGHKFKRAVRAL